MLQAGPANARLTRFLFVTPCFRVTPPQRSHCLPKHRHRIPRCDNTMPFASIWLGLGLALTSTIGRYRLTLKTCAVPGTQQGFCSGAQKAAPAEKRRSQRQNLDSIFLPLRFQSIILPRFPYVRKFLSWHIPSLCRAQTRQASSRLFT